MKSKHIRFIGSVNVIVHSVNPDPELVYPESTMSAVTAAQGTKLFTRHKGDKQF